MTYLEALLIVRNTFSSTRHKSPDEKEKHKIGDQTDGFATVSVQSFHEENMKLIQLVSETKNAKNTEILLKLLEDRTKCVENLVELEKIREANKALGKEDDRDVKDKKPEIQKRDAKRKRPTEKKQELQKKDGKEEASSSRPALQPGGDEIVRAREKAQKKILPCPRCDSRNTIFDKFSRNNLSKPVRSCKDCKRSWVARGNLGRG
ncbi:cyclic dof factor 2-like isoform X3 [Malus sylvestris]|uniref:cyclic dof factor 2-like isoform X3 n=1 Tax=Malus sylvestris TaxID=3752 RepID=UPI0021ABF9B6|nr:cyclic dof factor 2-like isoform X3 [Malus sylvestris]